MKKVMIVLGIILIGLASCEKSKEERKSKIEESERKSNLSSTEKKGTDFFKRRPEKTSQKTQSPVQHENIVLKWAHEEIGEIGIFSKPSYRGGGIVFVGSRKPGPKISKEGILYVDVISPDGPKLYAIDVISGKILKSKDLEPGYYLLGISQKAIYLAPFVKDHETKSLLVLDRIEWAPLWEKELTGRARTWSSFYLTEKGVLCSNGLLDELTGQLQLFSKPRGHIGLIGQNIILFEHSKATGEETYIVTAVDLSTGKVLSTKEWLWGHNDRHWLLAQCEAEGNFFVIGGDFYIHCVDTKTGHIKWKTEKLFRPMLTKLAGVTKKVVIIYGELIQEHIPYTFWYGIDATNGKVLWKKWAKPSRERDKPSNPFYMGGSYEWTETANEILLIGRFGKLVLVNSLTGEVIAQEKEFPKTDGHRHAVYKDMLIIGTPNGLRAYQIKK